MLEDTFFTKDYLKNTYSKVVEDLKEVGLFIPDIPFYYVLFGIERALFFNDSPRVIFSQFSLIEAIGNIISALFKDSDKIKEGKHSDAYDMKEVMYHEFGHAFVDFYYRHNRMFNKGFKRIFGNLLDTEEVKFKKMIHISEYASVNPNEDFAECFMYFMKWKGNWKDKKLHGRDHTGGVYQKMQFIGRFVKKDS